MLDIRFVKENQELVAQNLKNRKIKTVDLDQLVAFYDEYLVLLKKVEDHRAIRNKLTEDISKVAADSRQKLIAEASEIKSEIQKLEQELDEKKFRYEEILVRVPNMLSPNTPIGNGDPDHKIVKVWLPETGYLKDAEKYEYFDLSYMPAKTDFKHKDHIELGENLQLIDTSQSAKVSGSRFCYLLNEAVLLQDALASFLKAELLRRGFMPMVPPVLVKERALFGTSHFVEGRDQVYEIEDTNVEENNKLFLVGSSESPNFAFFMDKVLDAKDLPAKVYANTSCFRSEVGSWGKDVRGIKRVHQFDKLEMDVVCRPDQSQQVFDELEEINEWLYQSLKIPYRVVNKCSGDCGYNATHFQYDNELWRPGEREFMELGSNTIATDYQARRMNIRFKDGSKLDYVHTVNDTGIPFGRMLIAVLENYQNFDGSVTVPEVLKKYTGFDKIISKVK